MDESLATTELHAKIADLERKLNYLHNLLGHPAYDTGIRYQPCPFCGTYGNPPVQPPRT